MEGSLFLGLIKTSKPEQFFKAGDTKHTEFNIWGSKVAMEHGICMCFSHSYLHLKKNDRGFFQPRFDDQAVPGFDGGFSSCTCVYPTDGELTELLEIRSKSRMGQTKKKTLR